MEDARVDVGEKIEDSPHYRVEIRPLQYKKLRIPNLHGAKRLIHESRVSRRGWDFPHARLDERDWLVQEDFVENTTRFLEHFESWRLYLSGQFVFKSVIRELSEFYQEERVRSGSASKRPILSSKNWVWNITEFTEFAHRLGSGLHLEDSLQLEVRLEGVRDAGIGGWVREVIGVPSGVCLTDSIALSRTLRSPLATTNYDEEARGLVIELLACFNLRVVGEQVRPIQEELLSLFIGSDKPRYEAKAS